VKVAAIALNMAKTPQPKTVTRAQQDRASKRIPNPQGSLTWLSPDERRTADSLDAIPRPAINAANESLASRLHDIGIDEHATEPVILCNILRGY
jgi:hypothetical protein